MRRAHRSIAAALRGGVSVASALLLAAAGPVAARAQDGDPPLPPLPAPPAIEAPQRAPLFASDGAPVAPGRIPEGTSEEARERWARLLAATVERAGARPPVRSFDLTFEITLREPSGSNQTVARYAFLADRGFLRCEMLRSGRVNLRGPQGDWLIDEGRATSLAGRQNEVSRREMDEWVSIARSFIALTRPEGLRLVELAAREGAGLSLPTEELRALGAELDWIEVQSPDFHLVSGEPRPRVPGAPERVYHATFGIERGSGAVRLALLREPRSGAAPRLIEVRAWRPLGDYRVPRRLLLYEPRAEGPAGFEERPRIDLYLHEDSRLNPPLAPDDFRLD